MSDPTADPPIRAGRRPVDARRRPPGAGLLRLYPAAWRARYETEMLAMLEELEIGPRDRIDLVRGALDARLHEPSRVPATAALLAGAIWAVAGTGVLVQPVPPAWPGYLVETLAPAAVAVVTGAAAAVGCWARRSDATGRLGTVAVLVAIAGHLAWLVALAMAFTGIEYGEVTAAAQAAGVMGTLLVGIALLRSGSVALGAPLALGSAAMTFAWPAAWLGYGFGWTLVGLLLIWDGDAPAPRLRPIG